MAPSQWALITGVGAGSMGEGHANAFLNRGINVICTSIDMMFLENLNLVDGKNGAYPVRMELDVTSSESIGSAVDRISKITGNRLDFLLNNAGYGYYMPLLDVDIEKARKQYEVNVWGVLGVTQAFFPMLRAAKGTVVNQSSMAGVQGFNRPFMGIYSSSKAAVYSLSDYMRIEFAPFDVKVVTLVTGAVKTGFYDNKDGGRSTSLPENSVYTPIQKHIEVMINRSFAEKGGHDRYALTRSTIAALLRNYWFRTRYVRRGWGATRVWLMHLLLPVWLIDRWARQAGQLDKLKKILRST